MGGSEGMAGSMIAPDGSLKIGPYTMAGELFTTGFPQGGGPCACSAVCCEGGVSVDLRERDAILAHRELIAGRMDETQDHDPAVWFESEEKEDPDFPSGSCVDTAVVNDKCAFLDRHGRCVLQTSAQDSGMHKWALKPVFCILYPIEISNGIVSVGRMLQGEQSCCRVSDAFATPLFLGCREELIHLVGEEGYQDMRTHYDSIQQAEARQ
ncbi:MAG: DUF3109 family protein [Bacteroidota bacterium]